MREGVEEGRKVQAREGERRVTSPGRVWNGIGFSTPRRPLHLDRHSYGATDNYYINVTRVYDSFNTVLHSRNHEWRTIRNVANCEAWSTYGEI